MMQARELRIGNLVLINRNIHVVDVIDYNQVIATETGLIELKYVKPIPLTEEWLLRFGAHKEGNFWIYDRFKLFYFKSYEYWYVIDLRTETYFTKLSCVHDWQNLVFQMNGKELTLEK